MKLLCYFNDSHSVESIDFILKTYCPKHIYTYLDDTERMFHVFGTSVFHRNANVIHINRNMKTNTFFTINALNVLIVELFGELDRSYVVDWTRYQDMLLLLDRNKKLKCHKIQFLRKENIE